MQTVAKALGDPEQAFVGHGVAFTVRMSGCAAYPKHVLDLVSPSVVWVFVWWSGLKGVTAGNAAEQQGFIAAVFCMYTLIHTLKCLLVTHSIE